MRELKFRVWKIENKKMSDIGTWPIYAADLSLPDELKENDGIIILQYTGLKDKNGREIYEDDILRVCADDEHSPNRDSGGGIIDFDIKRGFVQIGVVDFDSCSFSYTTLRTLHGKHEDIKAPIDWLANYEVIGNMYENPELLEGDSN